MQPTTSHKFLQTNGVKSVETLADNWVSFCQLRKSMKPALTQIKLNDDKAPNSRTNCWNDRQALLHHGIWKLQEEVKKMPEHGRKNFADLQSQKDSKRKTKTNFSLNGEMLYFDYESV